MSKSKQQIKQEFLHQIELYYRNFGNEWMLSDFPKPVRKHADYLEKYLLELEKIGLIRLKEDGKTFIINDLPSKFPDLA